MVLPTNEAMRLIRLTRKARRTVTRLLHATERCEAIAGIATPQPINRVGVMDADEACAYLDRLPTIPSKAKKPKANLDGISARTLDTLKAHPGAWLTVTAIKRSMGIEHSDRHGTRIVCAALARHATAGRAHRRDGPQSYEYRAT